MLSSDTQNDHNLGQKVELSKVKRSNAQKKNEEKIRRKQSTHKHTNICKKVLISRKVT